MKIYCINLKRCVDRKERMTHRFEVAGLLHNVTFIEAISYEDPIIDTYYPDLDIEKYKRVRCEIGCFASHLKALKMFVQTGEKRAIICEDDIMLHNDFKDRLKNIMENDNGTIPLIMLSHIIYKWNGIYWKGKDPRRKNLASINSQTYGTSCYMITRKYALSALHKFDRCFKGESWDKCMTDSTWDRTTSELITKTSGGCICIPPLAIDEGIDTMIQPESGDHIEYHCIWNYNNYNGGETGDISPLSKMKLVDFNVNKHVKYMNKLDEFPDIYCINLLDNVDRRNRMKFRIKSAGLLSKCNFVEAISYTDKSVQQWISNIDNVSTDMLKQKKCVLACYLSHQKALQEFISTGNDYAIICEDDMMLCDDFMDKYFSILGNTPESFTVLMLSSQIWNWKGYTWEGLNPEAKNLINIIPETTWGAGMYVISRDYAIHIIKLQEERNDNMMDRYSEDLIRFSGGYVAIPPLAVEDCYGTTIQHTQPEHTQHFNIHRMWGFEKYISSEKELEHIALADSSKFSNSLKPTINLDTSIQFKQNKTLVTAFYNCCEHHQLTPDNYLLSLNDNMIIFAMKEDIPSIMNYRKTLYHKTKIISIPSWYISLQHTYDIKDVYLLYQAVTFNPFNSTHFAWIDTSLGSYTEIQSLPTSFGDKIKIASKHLDNTDGLTILTGSLDHIRLLCEYLEISKSIRAVNTLHPEIFDIYFGDDEDIISHRYYTIEQYVQTLKDSHRHTELQRILVQYPQYSNESWYKDTLSQYNIPIPPLSNQIVSIDTSSITNPNFWNTLVSSSEYREYVDSHYTDIYKLLEKSSGPFGKSLDILCYKTDKIKPWDIDSVKEGLPGSEESVVYFSQQMAKLGFKVTVYGMPPEKSIWKLKIANPRFVDATTFSYASKHDTVIIWRQPWLASSIRANTILFWPMDILVSPVPIDSTICIKGSLWLSEYQRRQFISVDPHFERFKTVYGCGFEGNVPDNVVRHNPYSCIYGSNYARGLNVLIEIWPRIKSRFPRATLDIYYGSNTWGLMSPQEEHNFLNLIRSLKSLGVTEHGTVGHDELAVAYSKASIWTYPCTPFDETFCITALRVQSVGCIPVVCRRAALNETVAPFAPSLSVEDMTVQNYENLLISVLERAEHITEDERQQYRDFTKKWSWSNIAQQVTQDFNL